MSPGLALSKCMRLHGPGQSLVEESRDIPAPAPGEVVLRVRACGVCRTDLHVVDGDIGLPVLPIVPGHEVVGEVVATGPGVSWPLGSRLGVPWLGRTCGTCQYCLTGQENLCDSAQFTGCQLDGGYAEHIVANAAYCFEIPAAMDDAHAAPLLCAGLIGYRSLRMAGEAQRLGLYGFGAAAHIIAQVAVWQGREVYAFTRPGDTAAQKLAIELGARWAGDSYRAPPVMLDAAIIFAPVGALVPTALSALRKGGTLVCAGIHMSDLPSFPYSLLWGERIVRSVANLTRRDGTEFLELAPRVPVRTHVEIFPLSQANLALERLRTGKINGAAVLVP
ncbi:MAG TPA: zinc-dependent alcohol dehydrogenase family protein [Steroidobacteraceae bacterium]